MHLNHIIFFFSLLNSIKFGYSIVGGQHAKLPPYDDPVVFVNHIGKYSRVQGYFNPITSLYIFRGIKYAEPPIRENRFLRPKKKRLVGDVDARKNAPPCPQPDYYDERKIIGDEDCLALNIFTPQMPDETTGLPVILFIHGGGYRYGSAAQYGAEPLIQDKVIFVPVQYRLGTLGIIGDGTKEFGGNVAMFDMHAALQWVTEYISFFGGDKSNIKVMGHGSGASSAMFISRSPYGRDSLNGVMAMSGSSLNQFSYDENGINSTEQIAKAHNCSHDNEVELISCLRLKSTEDLIEKDSSLQVERLHEQNMVRAMSGMVAIAPNIEVYDDERGLPGILTDKPDTTLKKEPQKKIPLLIGTCKDETAGGIDQAEIKKIFSSFTAFLKTSAKTIKVKGLIVNTTSNLMSSLGLPSLNEYLTIPENLSPEKILLKLIETTTDVFFNIPSIFAADLWGKFSSAFFYNFDYHGDIGSSGQKFLKPLPLVSKQRPKGFVAHGDDLVYLFDAHDIYGNRINESKLKSSSDEEVRNNFIKIIHSFAYINNSQHQFSIDNQILSSFRADSTSFMKISKGITVEKDFRFCQLSVLGAPLKATRDISCKFLTENLKILSAVPKINEVLSGSSNNNYNGKKFGLF